MYAYNNQDSLSLQHT